MKRDERGGGFHPYSPARNVLARDKQRAAGSAPQDTLALSPNPHPNTLHSTFFFLSAHPLHPAVPGTTASPRRRA